jgi:ferredoxin
LLTGAQKSWYHYHSGDPEKFARILIEMFRLRPPDLVIIDAILAMEGYGPASPETRWVNKILASDDAVALDTVEANIIGFGVEDVPTLRIARDLRLGETDLKAIQVMGDASTIEEYHRPTPPDSSYSYKAGVGSGRTSREYFQQRVCYRPTISVDHCQHQQGCVACVDVCPSGALTKGRETPALDASICMICCACMEACDFSSLELRPDEQLMASLPE